MFSEVGQDARALQLLDVLLRKEPNNPLFLRKKGQLLLRSGRRAEALSALQQAVQAAHGDPHAYFEVAEALRAQGAYADAIAYYRRGLEVDPNSRHGRLALSETLFLAGQYPEAIQIADPLLKEDPNDLAAWKARADAFRALGRPNEVLYSLKAILLLEPDNGPALLEMYRLHRDSKETKEAYATLVRLLGSSAPEAQDATLHLERGDLAATLGKTEEANEAYERAASLDPMMRVEIATRRARLRLTAGRPDLALEVLDEGLKSVPAGSPTNVAALLLRAEVLSALERPGEARAAYEEVRQRDPKSPVALAGIAKSMLDEGKHAEAVEFLRAAIPQVPPQESLYLLLAEAHSGLGQNDLASDAVKKGVEALPKSVALWVRAGEIAVARQAWPDAASSFAHALALRPAGVDILLRAGFVAERMEHPNEALAFYERATEADPANKQAWTSRGLALLATGRPTDAQTSFDRALALDSDFAAAKDGKKVALQKTRDAEVQRRAREALLLEARLNRTVTKNDLFVTLHVPYELLEPVLTAIGRNVKVNLDRLTPTEIRDLENASYHLITAAVEHRPPGIERRGLTLADVAVLSPPGVHARPDRAAVRLPPRRSRGGPPSRESPADAGRRGARSQGARASPRAKDPLPARSDAARRDLQGAPHQGRRAGRFGGSCPARRSRPRGVLPRVPSPRGGGGASARRGRGRCRPGLRDRTERVGRRPCRCAGLDRGTGGAGTFRPGRDGARPSSRVSEVHRLWGNRFGRP